MSLRKLLNVVLVLLAVQCAQAKQLKVGDAFPDIGKAGLQGDGNLPADLRGKVLLVDFWASWCGPCKLSFPVLNELHTKYGSQGLVIVGISVDDAKKAMETFLRKTPAQFPVLHDGGHQLVSQVEVATMPTSFLIDRSGVVRFIHTGFHGEKTRADYIREVESLLKDTKGQ